MEVISTAPELRIRLDGWRARGERIAFVPTMGNLHAGHYALVRLARAKAARVVVSIFVNPTQFGAGEDFERYPRTLDADREGLVAEGTDLLFLPGMADMYPLGIELAARVHVPGLSGILCGASRPGHFDGVAGVVLRLFNMVMPDIAVFGEKDYQQLLLIRRLVADLALPIDIRAGATVREPDGLALSSRNRYLDADARARAPALYATLQWMGAAWCEGRQPESIESEALVRLRSAGLDPDYCVLRRADDLADPVPGDTALRALGAVRVGSARLIDNIAVG
jgi:pantoate--beta-alanine ligase